MKITTIIPCYNATNTIEECIRSVIGQDNKDLEIICVNDGSTDDTLMKLRGFSSSDKRIKIVDKKNQGLSFARRDGLSQATGDFVHFLDSDDWLSSNDVYSQPEINNSADIITFNFNSVKEGVISYRTTGKQNSFKNIVKGRAGIWIRLFRRDVISEKDFTDVKFAEDVHTTLSSAMKSSNFAKVNKPLINYRSSNQSMSGKSNPNILDAKRSVTELIEKTTDKNKIKLLKGRVIYQVSANIYIAKKNNYSKDIIKKLRKQYKGYRKHWMHTNFKANIYMVLSTIGINL